MNKSSNSDSPHNLSEYIDYGFRALFALLVTYGINEVKDLRTNIESLNEKMATVVERSISQDSKVTELKDRVRYLEQREIERTTHRGQ